jgi:periplasmic divalent cation tolerance protein
MAERAVLLLTTLSNEESAAQIGRELVEARLCACASVVPGVRSIYHWLGEIKDEGEALLLLKTTSARVERLRAGLLKRHPYDVPEVMVIDVDRVPKRYLRWLDEETT